MDPTDVRLGFDILLGADMASLDRDGVARLVALSARLRGWHDSIDMRLSRRTSDLKSAGKSEGPESMFSGVGNRSSKESEDVRRRADVGEQMPSFQTGLEKGEVSSGHLDAMANVRSRLDDETRAKFDEREPELLAAAAKESVDAFARRCRELARRLTPAKSDADELDKQRAQSSVKRWVDKITGMHHTKLELDPIRDGAIWSAVERALATLKQRDGNAGTPWQQMQVNAFVAAVQGGVIVDDDPSNVAPGSQPADGPDAAMRRVEQRIPEITVLIDLQMLLGGASSGGVCESEDGIPLPVSTVRRLCCDAEIIPAVLGADGEVLDLGRSARTVNRAQRRTLRAMHRTCGFPDCTVPFSACNIHHVRWWFRDRGPTDIDNLLPLCERHHHLVHEGGWTLTMTPDRVATWIRRDGSIHHVGSTIDRRTASTRRTTEFTRRQAPDNRPADRPMTT